MNRTGAENGVAVSRKTECGRPASEKGAENTGTTEENNYSKKEKRAGAGAGAEAAGARHL